MIFSDNPQAMLLPPLNTYRKRGEIMKIRCKHLDILYHAFFQNFKPQRTYIGRDETGATLYS